MASTVVLYNLEIEYKVSPFLTVYRFVATDEDFFFVRDFLDLVSYL